MKPPELDAEVLIKCTAAVAGLHGLEDSASKTIPVLLHLEGLPASANRPPVLQKVQVMLSIEAAEAIATGLTNAALHLRESAE